MLVASRRHSSSRDESGVGRLDAPFCSCNKAYAEDGALNGRSPHEHAEKEKANTIGSYKQGCEKTEGTRPRHALGCRNTARHLSSKTRTGTRVCNGVEPLRAATRELKLSLQQSLEFHTPVPGKGGTATGQSDSPGQKRPPPCNLLRLARATVLQAIQRQPQQIPGTRLGRARQVTEHTTSSCITTHN